MRLELLHRLPELSDAELRNLPQPWADYARRLSRGLHEMSKADIHAVRELDAPPVLCVYRSTNQSLTNNTLTQVAYDVATIDTHGWWSASTNLYTPLLPGFYRCAWGICFHDTSAIAASTYAYSQLNTARVAIGYGNGSALDVMTSGSTVIECDGSTTTIGVKGLILTGVAATVFAGSPYRTWLDVDYIGRRLVT